MNVLEVEEQIPVRTRTIGKDRILRYVLLSVAAIYIIVSLYFIFNTRSRLASIAAAHDAAIVNLQQRQAATENDLKISSQALTEQLGMTQKEMQLKYAGTTTELHQQKKLSRNACKTSRASRARRSVRSAAR